MTQTTAPFRSVSARTAVEIAVREAERLGVHLRTEQIGSTTMSRLTRDETGLAVGCGKGSGAQGLASAHFEALERYLMSTPDNRRLLPGAASVLPASEVAGQAALRRDLVVQRWAAEFPESRAACVVHRGAGSVVSYPVFLSDPRYFRRPLPGDSVQPYRSLLRYASSLGTAAGVNVAEAVFHGLCELVEHDALSLALLRWFVARACDVDLVDPQSLPDQLRALYLDAVDAVGGSVYLIDVTTDLDVPVYLAVGEPDDGQPALLGAGASPLAPYAAERALSELVQASALAGTGSSGRLNPAARLAAWPALQECVLLPIRHLLSGTVRRVDLRDTPGDHHSPEWGLDQVSRRLREHDIEFYVCEVAPPGSLVSVATTIAPGLERFSLVRLGVPVIPTGRGWSVWTTART